MASLLDSILASMQAGNGATGILGSGPTTQPQTDAEKQAANQAWLDTLMGATQGVQKDPYSSPAMLGGIGQPAGVQNPPTPTPAAPPADPYSYAGLSPNDSSFLGVAPSSGTSPVSSLPPAQSVAPQFPMTPPQGPMQPPPPATAPAAMPPPNAMPVSMPMAQPAAAAAPTGPAAAPRSPFAGFNNYIDNNRATLMALAGGLASGGIGQGFSEAAKIQALNTPKWEKIGTDVYGNPQMGWVNPHTMTVTPATNVGGGSGIQNVDPTKPLYGQLPKADQGLVDSMLTGKQTPPSAATLKTPRWNTLLAAADEKARALGQPGFDATTWSQRKKAADDLAPQGRSGKTINALDTVEGHIGEKLIPAIDKLEKTGVAPDLPVANWIQNLGTSIAPGLMKERTQAVTSFNNARKAVVDEMGNAYKAGHLTDNEVKEWSALIMSSDSIIKLRQATADFVDLLNTKRQKTIDQYAGLGVEFKGENAEQNARITKLAHDKNMGVSAGAGTPAGAPAQSVPPPEQRAPGVYQTPKGPLRWTGTGWLPS